MPAIVTPTERRKVAIAFARRLADHLAIGANDYKALPVIAEQFRATGRDAGQQIADAADAIAKAMTEGHTKSAWEPHVETFGDHLVSLVSLAYEEGTGKLEVALRAAADTLESDVRNGYDDFPKASGAFYL